MVICCYVERLNLGSKKPAEEAFSEGLLVTAICLQGDQLVLVRLAFVWHLPAFSTEGQSPGNTGCLVSLHLEHSARFLSREGKECVLSCPALCNSTDPARLLSPWDSPGNNTGVGCHFLLKRIWTIQGSNPHLLCLLHCRRILYHLSHPSNIKLEGEKLEVEILSGALTCEWQARTPAGKPSGTIVREYFIVFFGLSSMEPKSSFPLTITMQPAKAEETTYSQVSVVL